MMPRDALAELLARIGANGGAAVFVGAQELEEWPAAAVAAMKAQKLIAPASPAASAVCPGCERGCVMPVHVIPARSDVARAFVICDKRSDINRVNVPIGSLEQWQASGATVAAWLANLLGLHGSSPTYSAPDRWEVGVFRGTTHASHIVLLADRELRLALAGHSMRLADALDVQGDRVVIDRRMLNRCVDHPVAGAGDTESAEARRDRLKARVQAEKAKGTRAFLKTVAREEGISVSRLKQITESKPERQGAWAGLQANAPSSKKRKP